MYGSVQQQQQPKHTSCGKRQADSSSSMQHPEAELKSQTAAKI
jgi:hypothetical protein